MAVNVEGLIHRLGKTYQEMMDADLIPYRTKPTGFSGDEVVCLDMVKEGIFLAFYRKGLIFKEMTIKLRDKKNINYIFPSKLPTPLVLSMTRQWLHQQLGSPAQAVPPHKMLNESIGWIELYNLLDFNPPTSMQVDYDLQEQVNDVTFLLTSEVRW